MKNKAQLYNQRKEIHAQYENGHQIVELADMYGTTPHVIQGVLNDYTEEIINEFRKLPAAEKKNRQELQRIKLKYEIQNGRIKNQD